MKNYMEKSQKCNWSSKKKTHRNQETTTCELADLEMDKVTPLHGETLFQDDDFPN
jgi:hypothetical protein